MSSFLHYSTRKTQKLDRTSAPGPFGFLNIHAVANIKKMKGHTLKTSKKFSKRSLTIPQKMKRGTLWDFSTYILSQIIEQMEEGTLWTTKFSKKKSPNAKKLERDPALFPFHPTLFKENKLNIKDYI